MTTFYRSRFWSFIVAVAFGILAFFALPAFGQVPGVTYVPPPAGVDWMALGYAVACVTGAVLFLRAIFWRWLAPIPATELSKAVTMVLAVLAGLGAGALGIAGGSTLGERLTHGFLAAAVATFGRDLVVRGWRVPAERKAATDAKELTPGPFGGTT